MAIAKSEYLEASIRGRWSTSETTWGSEVLGGISLPLEDAVLLKINPVKVRWEGDMAYGYPDENVSAVCPIGQTVTVAYRTPIFPEIAPRIASAITRSGDILRSFTFQKGHPTLSTIITDYQATGCKLGDLTITSDMSSPLVIAEMNFTGYKATESLTLSNTPAPTTPFRTRSTTVTVGTAITKFDSLVIRMTNDLSPGPPNVSGYIGYLDEHFRHASVELTFPQAARTYVTEHINLTTTTQYNVVVVVGNGTNQLTFTASKSIFEGDPIQEVSVKGVRKLRLTFKAKAAGVGTGTWTLVYT